MNEKPMPARIAVTMGDPAGIGPEIILKALHHPTVYGQCLPTVYGDLAWIRRVAAHLGFDDSVLEAADPLVRQVGPAAAQAKAGVVLVRQSTSVDLRGIVPGELSADAGKAAAESVLGAAKAVIAGEADAIVTAPINKEAIALGGYPYAGHTELLAEITGTRSYGMLLLAGNLRVIHVSTHVSLSDAIRRVRAPRIVECIRLGHAACLQLGIECPRVAVAGLNPHAGEHGLFGSEDANEIAPAVAEARSLGIDASGPHAPDTIFCRSVAGEFDLVVAMYHDQGHIPVKLLGIDDGVNVTVGLPIIRVSVDHGTAFDIANKGCAREGSMLEAIRVSCLMVKARGTSANLPGATVCT